MTALQRYAALALLGIATADMDDEAPGERTVAPAVDEKIDPATNAKYLRRCLELGRNKEQVEKFIGKPVPEWTSKDLETIKGWMGAAAQKTTTANPETAGAAPHTSSAGASDGGSEPQPEPGEDRGESNPFDSRCTCGFTCPGPAEYADHLAATGHGKFKCGDAGCKFSADDEDEVGSHQLGAGHGSYRQPNEPKEKARKR
jgi:hypothetical protein